MSPVKIINYGNLGKLLKRHITPLAEQPKDSAGSLGLSSSWCIIDHVPFCLLPFLFRTRCTALMYENLSCGNVISRRCYRKKEKIAAPSLHQVPVLAHQLVPTSTTPVPQPCQVQISSSSFLYIICLRLGTSFLVLFSNSSFSFTFLFFLMSYF